MSHHKREIEIATLSAAELCARSAALRARSAAMVASSELLNARSNVLLVRSAEICCHSLAIQQIAGAVLARSRKQTGAR